MPQIQAMFGAAIDARADLYSLGCMAYECLIGRPVWNMDQGVAMTFASIATVSACGSR